MRTSSSAASRGRAALDSQADVETQLYKRPAQAESGIQKIVPSPIVPHRVIEVKQAPRRRALGLNVFLMPAAATDPAPPWVVLAKKTASLEVARKRSRWPYVLGLVAFVIAFVAVGSPNTRTTVIDRSRPYAARMWTATKHAARWTVDFSVREWRALSAQP